LMLNDPISAAALLRGVGLRSELAAGVKDRQTARRYSAILSALWANADEDLKPVWRRMSILAAK
jgi:hypothetical protein